MDWPTLLMVVQSAIEETETGLPAGSPFDERYHFPLVFWHADMRWQQEGGSLPPADERAMRVAFAVLVCRDPRQEIPPVDLVEHALEAYRSALADRGSRTEPETGDWALEVATAFSLGWHRQEEGRPRTGPSWHPIRLGDGGWAGEHESARRLLDETMRPVIDLWTRRLDQSNHGPDRSLRHSWWNHGVIGFQQVGAPEFWLARMRSIYLGSGRHHCPCGEKIPWDEPGAANRWLEICRTWHRLRSWKPQAVPLWLHARRAAQGFAEPASFPESGDATANFRYGLLHHAFWDGGSPRPANAYKLVPQPVVLRCYGEFDDSPLPDQSRLEEPPLIVREELVIIPTGACDRRPGRVRPSRADWRHARRYECRHVAVDSSDPATCAECGSPLAGGEPQGAWHFRRA